MSSRGDPARVKFCTLLRTAAPGAAPAGAITMTDLQQLPSPRTTLVTMRTSSRLALNAVRIAATAGESAPADGDEGAMTRAPLTAAEGSGRDPAAG